MNSRLPAYAVWLLLASVTGCIVVPIPVPETKETAGHRLTDEDTVFIRPSVTTRDEVIQTFGPPSIDLGDPRIIGYAWAMLRGYVATAVAIPFPPPGGIVAGADHVSHPYVLLIAFDADDHVLQYATESRYFGTVRERALKWARQQGLPIPEPPNLAPGAPIPRGQSAVYIYRPGGRRDTGPATAVSVDGIVVADLAWRTYTAGILPPGSHTIHIESELNLLPPAMGFVSDLSFEALPDTVHYLKATVHDSFDQQAPKLVVDTDLTMISEEDALPVVERLRPVSTWTAPVKPSAEPHRSASAGIEMKQSKAH